MISKQKKLAYGSALVLTSALFALELVKAASAEEGAAPLELPAEVSFEALAATSGSATTEVASAPSANSGEPSLSSAPNEPLGAALESLEATLARLESPTDTDHSLALLQRARRRRGPMGEVEFTDDAASGAASADSERVEGARSRWEERDQQRERMERLEALLAEEPLIGVVRGANGGAAMFGGRVVKLGEALLGDDARVVSCDERGVGVELGGQSIRIALPPLRTRPRAAPNAGGAVEPRAQGAVPPPVAAPLANTQGGV